MFVFVRKLEVNRKYICDQTKIKNEIKIFFGEIVKCHKAKLFTSLATILKTCLV